MKRLLLIALFLLVGLTGSAKKPYTKKIERIDIPKVEMDDAIKKLLDTIIRSGPNKTKFGTKFDFEACFYHDEDGKYYFHVEALGIIDRYDGYYGVCTYKGYRFFFWGKKSDWVKTTKKKVPCKFIVLHESYMGYMSLTLNYGFYDMWRFRYEDDKWIFDSRW